MKYTVHVTVTYSVDVDPKKQGLRTKREVLEYAKGSYDLVGTEFDITAKIFDSYSDEPPARKIKKGVGSY